jgi:hypothetical protein
VLYTLFTMCTPHIMHVYEMSVAHETRRRQFFSKSSYTYMSPAVIARVRGGSTGMSSTRAWISTPAFARNLVLGRACETHHHFVQGQPLARLVARLTTTPKHGHQLSNLRQLLKSSDLIFDLKTQCNFDHPILITRQNASNARGRSELASFPHRRLLHRQLLEQCEL